MSYVQRWAFEDFLQDVFQERTYKQEVLTNCCPLCPAREDVDERYAIIAPCSTHRVDEKGSEDGVFSFNKDFASITESESETNRAWWKMQNDLRKAKRRKRISK